MRKKNKLDIKVMFCLMVACELMVMILANVIFKNTLVIVYGNFAIEIFTTLYVLSVEQFEISMERNEVTIILLFTVGQLMMFGITSILEKTLFFDVHKLLMCLGLLYSTFFSAKRIKCNIKEYDIILNILIIVGIVSTLYNFFVNFSTFKMGNLTRILFYSWNFRSFFSSRAAYGTFLALCAIIALMKSEQSGKKMFLLLFFWFSANILITAARAQCISLICGVIAYLLYSKRYRKFVIIAGLFGLVYVLLLNNEYFVNLIDKYFMLFDHSRDRSTDITTGRLELWTTAFSYMNPWNWLLGVGIGAKDTVMALNAVSILGQQLLSFHSGYVDLVFETGLFGLLIWGWSVKRTFHAVKRQCPVNVRHFFYASLIAISISNVFDSCYMIFTTDTMAVFATFMIIVFPNAVANYYKCSEM